MTEWLQAVIGQQAMVAAGGVITPGMTIPARTLAAGSPATVKKELSGAALASVERSARAYQELSKHYLAQNLGLAVNSPLDRPTD